ncbi:putative membrane protein [Methanocalculus sp. AMF5]|uniref:DUF1622 domain-containing protein n=1 Tax=Methanocalculus sp. AMF5 TaxID=1198257 RepID=UPI00209E90B6|nr:DUF1622 domain-containing protein [Methanocalculus sp. AMF5]MCP1661756.1 putative membrane protein [Methanocalculus sp. AMF5]
MHYLNLILDYCILIFEIAGAIMIIYGGIRGAIGIIKIEIFRSRTLKYGHIRRYFSNKIIFGLEFIIAADILATIIAPKLEDILLLGAIVAIRTVLAYFLSKETMEYEMTDTCSLTGEKGN